MKIEVFNHETNEKIMEFKVRKNCKSIVKEVKKQIEKQFNCSIRNILPQGKIDFASGISEIHYVLWGDNLPCRIINYVSML